MRGIILYAVISQYEFLNDKPCGCRSPILKKRATDSLRVRLFEKERSLVKGQWLHVGKAEFLETNLSQSVLSSILGVLAQIL